MFAIEYDTDCDFDYLWVGIPCYRDPIVILHDHCSECDEQLECVIKVIDQ